MRRKWTHKVCLPSKALAASTRWAQSSGPSAPVSGRGMRTGSCSCCFFLSCSFSELSWAERSPGKEKDNSKTLDRRLKCNSRSSCNPLVYIFCFVGLRFVIQTNKSPQVSMYHIPWLAINTQIYPGIYVTLADWVRGEQWESVAWWSSWTDQ